ncbi:hypothetical protein O1L44_11340 [Streptomyces noursei]|nr:hypothetical protein [Streptomyces noursei]
MEQYTEEREARTARAVGRTTAAGPGAGRPAPTPAEAVGPDPDDAFLSAMRASGYASVPAGTEVTARGYAPRRRSSGVGRAGGRVDAAAGRRAAHRGRGGRGRLPGGPAASPAPAPVAGLLRRMPAAKLTGLGCGLLATAALLAFGFLDRWLFGGTQTAYGVFFLLVSVAAGAWVRPWTWSRRRSRCRSRSPSARCRCSTVPRASPGC